MLAGAALATYEMVKLQQEHDDVRSQAQNLREYLKNNEPGHRDMHKTTTDALSAIQKTIERMAGPPKDQNNEAL